MNEAVKTDIIETNWEERKRKKKGGMSCSIERKG